MTIQNIDCKRAQEILLENQDAIYLDVRSVPEFVMEHPARAVNIPLMHPGPMGMILNLDFEKVVSQVIPKDKKLLVGCMAGIRSKKACHILKAKGYRQIFYVAGGFGGGRHPETGELLLGWKDLGLPTSSGNWEGRSYESLCLKAKAKILDVGR